MNLPLLIPRIAGVLLATTCLLHGANPFSRISRIAASPTPATPGYLNYGEPFSLRKAPQLRPPVYALPELPISPDPQPLPLSSQVPSQPLNPANRQSEQAAPNAGSSIMPVLPIRPFTIQAQSVLVSPAIGAPLAVPGAEEQALQNPFLNPEIFRYFNPDANGTYQSRLRLNNRSLFTQPSFNPMLQRRSSTTYQIK